MNPCTEIIRYGCVEGDSNFANNFHSSAQGLGLIKRERQ